MVNFSHFFCIFKIQDINHENCIAHEVYFLPWVSFSCNLHILTLSLSKKTKLGSSRQEDKISGKIDIRDFGLYSVGPNNNKKIKLDPVVELNPYVNFFPRVFNVSCVGNCFTYPYNGIQLISYEIQLRLPLES